MTDQPQTLNLNRLALRLGALQLDLIVAEQTIDELRAECARLTALVADRDITPATT